MILKCYIKCDTCSETLIVRIQVFSNEKFEFQCPNCKEDLSLELEISQELINIKPIKNCNISNSHDSKFNAMYLSNKILTSNNIANSPLSPAVLYAYQIDSDNIKFVEHDLDKLWQLLHRAFKQKKLNNIDLYNKIIDEYNKILCVKFNSYEEYLFNFITANLGDNYYRKLEKVFEIISNLDRIKLKGLCRYIKSEMDTMLPRIDLLMNKYYELFDINYKFIVYIISDKKYDVKDFNFTDSQFDKIDMLYGNLFELLADLLLVNACINNIQNGRNYNEFEHKEYTLEKYKDNTKANKSTPFKNNKYLYAFCEEFDSQIRNGSHHLKMIYNKNINQIEYESNNSKKVLILKLIY